WPKWPRVAEQSEARFVAGPVFLDMTGEREADVARENQRAGRGAIVQHAAAADAGLLDIRVLREIPVRIIDLQQVMKDVADERGAIAANVQVEDKMSGRMAAGGRNIDELVEAMRPGHQVGTSGFDHRHDAFTKRAEFRRRGCGIVVELLKIIEIEF